MLQATINDIPVSAAFAETPSSTISYQWWMVHAPLLRYSTDVVVRCNRSGVEESSAISLDVNFSGGQDVDLLLGSSWCGGSSSANNAVYKSTDAAVASSQPEASFASATCNFTHVAGSVDSTAPFFSNTHSRDLHRNLECHGTTPRDSTVSGRTADQFEISGPSSAYAEPEAFKDNITQMLFGGTFSCLSTCSKDHDRLLLQSHGISPRDVWSRAHCRAVLAHHIVGGHCAAHNTNTCRNYSSGHSSRDIRFVTFQIFEEALLAPSRPSGLVRLLCSDLWIDNALSEHQDSLLHMLRTLLVEDDHTLVDVDSVVDSSNAIDGLDKLHVVASAMRHGILKEATLPALRESLEQHIFAGQCLSQSGWSTGCQSVIAKFPAYASSDISSSSIAASLIASRKAKIGPLRRLLIKHKVAFDKQDRHGRLRRLLRRAFRTQLKGKRVVDDLEFDLARDAEFLPRNEVSAKWPEKATQTFLDGLVSDFNRELASNNVREQICACCGELRSPTDIEQINTEDVDLLPLSRPDSANSAVHYDEDWLTGCSLATELPTPSKRWPEALLHKKGFFVRDEGSEFVNLCGNCKSSLDLSKLPDCAIANKLFLGDVPPVLQNLSQIEESIIGLCRARCMILQLREQNSNTRTKSNSQAPNCQTGLQGHVIVYPQSPDSVAKVLPPSIEEIVAPVCVIFIGHSPPSREWLHKYAKPLTVRADRIYAALVWLKRHNPLYRDVDIDHEALQSLSENPVLPFHVEHMLPETTSRNLTARYDTGNPGLNGPDQTLSESAISNSTPPQHSIASEARSANGQSIGPAFESVMISDVTVDSTPGEMRAAAIKHMKEKGKPFIAVPHGKDPEHDIKNVHLFPRLFPTLFPYGLAGFEDQSRGRELTMAAQVEHFMRWEDRRFQTHHSFLFIAFNILQRRKILLHTHLRVQREGFDRVAEMYSKVTAEDIEAVTDRVARGDYATVNSENEDIVMKLLRDVEVINAKVPGSSASKLAMRNEIRSMIQTKGLPAYFITVNPADCYNPLVKVLAGSEIDVDNMLPAEIPNYFDQSVLIARNPAVGAKFFHLFINAFIKTLLGWRGGSVISQGVLGSVKGYYGCVEAQGRGSLHCHMVVWIDGALPPDELKGRLISQPGSEFQQRLVECLEATISTEIPNENSTECPVESEQAADPPKTRKKPSVHPSSIREPRQLDHEPLDEFVKRRLSAFAELVKACQQHVHGPTCYKYCEGKGEKKVCRFGLDRAEILKHTVVNSKTGEINLKKLDGMVNNFNATILRAIRCNMDIKFIFSGPDAKAVLFYITDYISKAQLPTHVAYATLELAVRKLKVCVDSDTSIVKQAKSLLRKCANALIGRQELSSQQVASYIMNYSDHFTSHEFRNFYWVPFESWLEYLLPSPECRSGRKIVRNIQTMNEDGTLNPGQHRSERVHAENSGSQDKSSLRNDHGSNMLGERFVVGVDSRGELIPKMTHVADYVYRDKKLDSLSLWDFIAQVDKRVIDKVRRQMLLARLDLSNSRSNDSGSESSDEDSSVSEPEDASCLIKSKRGGQQYRLMSQHSHTDSQTLVIRPTSKRYIPVTIGPALPRKDVASTKARYSRLMLMFFKPWRNAADLREGFRSWDDAFESYVASECPARHQDVLNNIGLLQQCKQARDDHMRGRCFDDASRIPSDLTQPAYVADEADLSCAIDEQAILEEIERIEAVFSRQRADTLDSVAEATQTMQQFELFDFEGKVVENVDGAIQEITATNPREEIAWKRAYEARKRAWREKLKAADSSVVPVMSNAELQVAGIRTLQDFEPSTSARPVETFIGDIGAPSRDQSLTDDIDEIAQELTLNQRQNLAFRAVANRLDAQTSETPLRMFIGGAAGTGKTRVVDALKELFDRRGEQRRLRLCAFMGIAAKNISGSTLHSTLSMLPVTGGKKQGNIAELQAMWAGVDFLIVDEVSMISCQLMYQMNEALQTALGKELFGGINIIFCGDFAQLPPVKETRLNATLDTSVCSSETAQAILKGQQLWRNVDSVVLLTESNRQAKAKRFAELLNRLREGKCTQSDYKLLQTRIIGSEDLTTLGREWADATAIVYGNAKKDAFNEFGARRFAEATHQPLHWYYSEDSFGKSKPVQSRPLLDHLRGLSSGRTNHLLGKLPLVIGMPVYVAQNFDVAGGVANGTRGEITGIRYKLNAHNERILLSCTISVPDASGTPMPYLRSKEMPILPEATTFKIRHPYEPGEYISIRRRQLPIQPAFAITAYKAQGQTLDKVMVDLGETTKIETPYVMLSRARALEDVLILGDFEFEVISRKVSEDTRKENARLYGLSLRTMQRIGDNEQSQEASELLRALEHSQSTAKTKVLENDLRSMKRRRQIPDSDGSKSKRVKTVTH